METKRIICMPRSGEVLVEMPIFRDCYTKIDQNVLSIGKRWVSCGVKFICEGG